MDEDGTGSQLKMNYYYGGAGEAAEGSAASIRKIELSISDSMGLV